MNYACTDILICDRYIYLITYIHSYGKNNNIMQITKPCSGKSWNQTKLYFRMENWKDNHNWSMN